MRTHKHNQERSTEEQHKIQGRNRSEKNGKRKNPRMHDKRQWRPKERSKACAHSRNWTPSGNTDNTIKLEIIVFNAIIISKLLYGLESVQINDSLKTYIDTFELKA